MRGAFLHVLSDALGSVIVVISALVIMLTDWEYRFYMDPALSIILVVLILHSVWPLLRESALILLQTVPTHIQVSHWLRYKYIYICHLVLFCNEPILMNWIYGLIGRCHSKAATWKSWWCISRSWVSCMAIGWWSYYCIGSH